MGRGTEFPGQQNKKLEGKIENKGGCLAEPTNLDKLKLQMIARNRGIGMAILEISHFLGQLVGGNH